MPYLPTYITYLPIPRSLDATAASIPTLLSFKYTIRLPIGYQL